MPFQQIDIALNNWKNMGTTSPRSIVEEPPPPAPKEAIGEIKFLE